ncbi:MAG TPA: RNA polymerase sigma factor [Polyangiaceae bacterium]|jgi:RNA polymerase sigma factor (sigma-70 family)|nr:RNA polymerase sigma factor [Polyangiaceae bacterium]
MSFFEENPELLAPFRAGRRDALEKVYRAHVRGVECYVHSLSRSAGTRELVQLGALGDLLQEVFIRAFSPSSRQAYDGVRDYRRYLSAIARNCFIDALRARGREVLKAPEELGLDVDDTNAEPEFFCEPRVRAVLSVYLDELPPALEGVYQQRFVLGRSQEDASDALGLSRRQLRTAEEHLRTGLRRALLQAGVFRDAVAMIPSASAPKSALRT